MKEKKKKRKENKRGEKKKKKERTWVGVVSLILKRTSYRFEGVDTWF